MGGVRMAGRWMRDDHGRRASFVLCWSAVGALAGVTAWLLFSVPGTRQGVVSGDLAGLDATLVVLSGFLVGAAQAGVLSAHGVTGERAAVRHWLGMTLAWTTLWPARLVTPTITSNGPALRLFWLSLPCLIVGAISGVWLFVPTRFSPHPPPDGDGTLRLPVGIGQVEAPYGEAWRAMHLGHAAVAASDRREAA